MKLFNMSINQFDRRFRPAIIPDNARILRTAFTLRQIAIIMNKDLHTRKDGTA